MVSKVDALIVLLVVLLMFVFGAIVGSHGCVPEPSAPLEQRRL